MKNEQHRIIGRSVLKADAIEQLKGTVAYAADISLDNVVELVVLRSDRPHARILSIDASPALNMPGCLSVFTAADIPGNNRLGIINKDQRLLADDKVRFVGDPVACVAAETKSAAEEAAREIRILYEDLPAIFEPEDALKGDAPKIHETGNLLIRKVVSKGDADTALREAVTVVEGSYCTTFAEHAYLEPDAGIAYRDPDGIVVIHASTQNPHYDQKDVAELLGIDENQVRVIQAATGGGFGSKLDMNVQGYVALAAYKLGRPARLTYTREEAFLCTVKRHPLKIHCLTGASKTGQITVTKAHILGDTGAYASYGIAVAARAAIHLAGPYEIPHIHVVSEFAYTNNSMCGAMRGFGVPQVAFVHESQMDLLARKIGLDPLEIRKRNGLREGSRTATGQRLTAGVGISATMEALTPYYKKAIRKKTPPRKSYRKRGVGLANMMYGIGNTGVQNPSTARMEMNMNGELTLYTGAADLGQGSSTVLRQMAAEVLGQDPEDIMLVAADTRHTTNAGATSASRQTYISGNAVVDAATKLKNILLTEAAMIMHESREELILAGGRVQSRTNSENSVPFSRIARRAHRTGMPLAWQGFFDPRTTPLNPETGQGDPYAAYAFASHLAEIEVDTLTGEVHVIRVVAAHDVGRAINPQNVRGQIYSGVAMGMGYALMEEFIPGTTKSLKDYHIPTAADMPIIIPIIVEVPEPTGPFGAKGVGEPALIPTAPAILNALSDALGVRISSLPANLERVLKASSDMREGS